MKLTLAFALLLALGVAGRAHAQSVNVTDLSATNGAIGTSAALCVPAAGTPNGGPPARSTLFLFNSGGNPIDFGYNAGIAYGGAGTTRLLAGGSGSAFWGPGAAPKSAIWCISTGTGSALTIVVGAP